MTTRTDFTVEWDLSPRIITVAAPSTSVTIQDIVDTLRVIEETTRGMSEPKLLNAAGKEPLGGGVLVGITASLQNALIAFEARGGPSFEQCVISGGNLVAFDEFDVVASTPVQSTPYTQVLYSASSSTTLQESADIEYASFNGGVTIDESAATSGTVFPFGTPRQPVNNLPDAQTIATERGFDTIYIVGDFTFDAADSVTGFNFTGNGIARTTITCTAAATITNCEFSDCAILGSLGGISTLINCSVGALDEVQGVMERCLFEQATITTSGAGYLRIVNCVSGVPGLTTPVLDLNGGGTDLLMRNYTGGIDLQNLTSAGDNISLDFLSGNCIIDSTVTAGTINVRGITLINDNSTGTAAVNIDGVVSPTELSLAEATLRNKVITDPVTGIMTVYAADGVTPLYTAQLYEDAAGLQTYRGQGAERRERLT